MVCKVQNTNRIFKMFFRNEIDVSMTLMLTFNPHRKILGVYLTYFTATVRLILQIFFSAFSVTLRIVFLRNTNEKALHSRRGSSYRPGMECVFLIIYSLTLRWPGSATAVPAADRQVPLPAGLPQGSAPGLHGTAGPLQTPPLRPVRSRYARRSRGRYRAAGHQG